MHVCHKIVYWGLSTIFSIRYDAVKLATVADDTAVFTIDENPHVFTKKLQIASSFTTLESVR